MQTETRIDRKRVEEHDARKENGIEISQTGTKNTVVLKENVTKTKDCRPVPMYLLDCRWRRIESSERKSAGGKPSIGRGKEK